MVQGPAVFQASGVRSREHSAAPKFDQSYPALDIKSALDRGSKHRMMFHFYQSIQVFDYATSRKDDGMLMAKWINDRGRQELEEEEQAFPRLFYCEGKRSAPTQAFEKV